MQCEGCRAQIFYGTVQDKDGQVRDGYVCQGENCEKYREIQHEKPDATPVNTVAPLETGGMEGWFSGAGLPLYNMGRQDTRQATNSTPTCVWCEKPVTITDPATYVGRRSRGGEADVVYAHDEQASKDAASKYPGYDFEPKDPSRVEASVPDGALGFMGTCESRSHARNVRRTTRLHGVGTAGANYTMNAGAYVSGGTYPPGQGYGGQSYTSETLPGQPRQSGYAPTGVYAPQAPYIQRPANVYDRSPYGYYAPQHEPPQNAPGSTTYSQGPPAGGSFPPPYAPQPQGGYVQDANGQWYWQPYASVARPSAQQQSTTQSQSGSSFLSRVIHRDRTDDNRRSRW
nr:uncharacterized protein CI109_005585 [Kwoniella shandongensis]KAA5526150.1 hypothetical protein CI109_005585 [Kwoniella shandongensis]